MDVKRNILKLVVLFIYIGLPFLIFIGLIPFDYKFYTLTIGGIIVYIIMKVLGFKNRELGIKEESAWQLNWTPKFGQRKKTHQSYDK